MTHGGGVIHVIWPCGPRPLHSRTSTAADFTAALHKEPPCLHSGSAPAPPGGEPWRARSLSRLSLSGAVAIASLRRPAPAPERDGRQRHHHGPGQHLHRPDRPRFQADVRKVLALEPDFVTYNEVPFRNDAVIAPDGLRPLPRHDRPVHRRTPVAWRADRWTAIDQGTFLISNWRGKPPGREVELGRRYANWVTLPGRRRPGALRGLGARGPGGPAACPTCCAAP